MNTKDEYIPRVQPEQIDTEEKAREAVEKLREAIRFHDGITAKDLIRPANEADKSAKNLLREIKKAKKVSLGRLLYALGIPLLGSHMAQVLASHFRDLDTLRKAGNEELQQIEEVGPEDARSISSFASRVRLITWWRDRIREPNWAKQKNMTSRYFAKSISFPFLRPGGVPL